MITGRRRSGSRQDARGANGGLCRAVVETSAGMIPLSGELTGSAGLGAVWGWLLVQLTVAARPSVRWLVVPLVATGALLGTMLVLAGVRAVVTCAVATGAAAVLHGALYARLRLQAESRESFEISEGGPR